MTGRRARILLSLAVAAAVAAAAAGCQKKPRDPSNVPEMKEKISKGTGVILWKVDATKEQEKLLDRLFDGAAPDFLGFQQESKAITRKVMDVLEAEPIDTAELDRLQASATALFDRYMRRLFKAGRDAAGIFTPAQRRTLVRLWREWEFGG